MSNLLLCHGNHSAARLLYTLLKAFSVLAITSVPVSILPQTGGRGLCSHRPLGVCVLGRHHGCEGWDLHPQSPGYEPGELLFLYPAIVALTGYVPISGASQTILHKFGKERKFSLCTKGKEYRSFTHCRTHSRSAPLIYIPSLVFIGRKESKLNYHSIIIYYNINLRICQNFKPIEFYVVKALTLLQCWVRTNVVSVEGKCLILLTNRKIVAVSALFCVARLVNLPSSIID